MMQPIIEIRGVSVAYREEIALRDVSLDVADGDFISVIGPNGAGKTTLLTVINGLGKILSGTVRIFGGSPDRHRWPETRRFIGYIPQLASIDPRSPISVREVVMLGRVGRIGLFRRARYEDREVVESMMEFTGIAHLADRPIGHLSGGERQKVEVARALAQQPRILLLDEPTTNMDLSAQKEIVNLIDRIYAENNLTILFVTHILSHLPKSCKRVILMREGRIIHSGDVSDILSAEQLLTHLYGCPVEVVKMDGRLVVQPRWG